MAELLSEIELVQEQLKRWIRSVLGQVNISLEAPGGTSSEQDINLYLMALEHAPPARGSYRPPLQIALHYLVTAWANEPESAQKLLLQLAFSGMEHAAYNVLFKPLGANEWLAFGIAPRPSFILQTPLYLERPEPEVALVRELPEWQKIPLRALFGQVVIPVHKTDVPLMGARVELLGLNLATRTNEQGRFRFPAVPVEPRSKRLRVRAKRRVREFSVDMQAVVSETEPLVIRFPYMED
jgi:hypothetical protein